MRGRSNSTCMELKRRGIIFISRCHAAPLQNSLLQKKSQSGQRRGRANDFSLFQYKGAQNIDKRMRKMTSTRSVAATFDGGLPPPSPYRWRVLQPYPPKKRQGKCRKVGQPKEGRREEGRQCSRVDASSSNSSRACDNLSPLHSFIPSPLTHF